MNLLQNNFVFHLSFCVAVLGSAVTTNGATSGEGIANPVYGSQGVAVTLNGDEQEVSLA